MQVDLISSTPDPEARISGVYEIVLVADGRRYIGSAIDIHERWRRHKKDLRGGRHHSTHLQRAWDKYGEDAFQFCVIEKCSSKKEEILQVEQAYLNKFNPEFNSCKLATSPLGIKHSQGTRAKVSAAAKRMWESQEHRAKHAEAMAKASQAIRETALSQSGLRSERAKNHNASYWSDETKLAQSQRRKAYASTEAGKAQLSAAGRATWNNEDAAASIKRKKKEFFASDAGKAHRVRMTEASQSKESRQKRADAVSVRVVATRLADGVTTEFKSITLAAKSIGVSISTCSVSIKRNGTTNGYKVRIA